ncbi:MAG: T9SS type A sorting domain-containing protein, partial [Ignavibacteriota bacterium]
CFKPTDTLTYDDTVIVTTDCFDAPLPIVGSGGTPLIFATDIDFGDVVVGTTVCKTLTVRNVGTTPFLLTKNYFLHDSLLFGLDPGPQGAGSLPIILKPSDKALILKFCYSPTKLGPDDSTSVDWRTDIPEPYTQQVKSWSYLKGHPIKPDVNWDRLTQLDSVICDDSIIIRVNLLNNSGTTAQVNRVYFTGPDSAQYYVLNDQLGKVPLVTFPMSDKDMIWVDVVFKPDLTRLPKYGDRHATLIAEYVDPADLNKNSITQIDFTDKVLHAELVFNPDTILLGFITKGSLTTGYVSITDTGDAPFVIKSLDFGYPIISIKDSNGIPVNIGDTIRRGQTVNVQIDVQLDNYTDTTVGYTFVSDHPCGDFPATLQAATSSRQVASTGYPAPNTFITCRQHDSVVTFTNLGSSKVTLDQVDIVSTPGATNVAEFDLKDAANTLQKTVVVNKLLAKNESVSIPIEYHPGIIGPVAATIRYTYDSAGVKFTLDQPATGVGMYVNTTLSVAPPNNAAQYTGDIGSVFTVPVTLATTALPFIADAYRVKFTLTYRRDVVNIQGTPTVNTGAGYNLYNGNAPRVNTLANGDESIDFDIVRAAPITNLEEIVNVTYRIMVATELTSPFIVSNITFFDSKNADINCYIGIDTIPAVFIPKDLCGDASLRNYLTGVLPTRISMVAPNVITESETPVLFYSINRSDLPVKVEIYDVLGQKVRTVKNLPSQVAGDYKLPIGVSSLPSGTYTIRLSTPESSETANFILQR